MTQFLWYFHKEVEHLYPQKEKNLFIAVYSQLLKLGSKQDTLQ